MLCNLRRWLCASCAREELMLVGAAQRPACRNCADVGLLDGGCPADAGRCAAGGAASSAAGRGFGFGAEDAGARAPEVEEMLAELAAEEGARRSRWRRNAGAWRGRSGPRAAWGGMSPTCGPSSFQRASDVMPTFPRPV